MAKRVNANNVNEKGEDVGSKIPGRPSERPSTEKRNVETKEILFSTPSGKLCKNIYEVFRTGTGTHRRLIKTLKNVKG